MRPRRLYWEMIALLALSSCASLERTTRPTEDKVSRSAAARTFTDVTLAAGIKHVHQKPALDHQLDNIMSWVASVGAAAAAGDFDNDGWIDLYVTNSNKGAPNYLYRNNHDGTFTDVAEKAGVAHVNDDGGVSMDCVWGDYDNDGWIDLYLVRWGTNILYHNRGDGTFENVTAKCFRKRDSSPGSQWANGNAAIFLDYNLDGRLDLYIGNYFDEIDLWHLKTTRIMHDSFERARNAGRNFLYRQEADGTFTEVGAQAGVDDPGWTLAVGSGDVDNDGWPDLYVADDFGPDQLFLNNHDGTFRNVTASAIGLDTKKGMNADFGDFDNDGWLDIYVANITTAEYLQEGNMLWHNNGLDAEGNLSMVDVSLETGTYDGGWGWGAKFFDADNDGDLDIIAVNGFISAGEGNYWYDLASWTVKDKDPTDARNWPTIGDRSFSGYERTRFFRNDGLQTFSERAEEVGLDSRQDGRGVVCFDYDNDGDLDVFVANQGQPPNLYRNEGTPGHHWLMVALQGDPATGTNRDAIGTRVTAVTAAGRQIRERDGGNGYCGQSDPRIHFGLGREESVKLLEIRWPDGGLQYLENVPADRLITVRQKRKAYAGQVEIVASTPKVWKSSKTNTKPPPPTIEPAELERLLAGMEESLQAGRYSHTLASAYRSRCSAYEKYDRSIEFFKRRCSQRPDDLDARLQLGCAYVDKIPTCGGMAAIVCKGTFARRSLDEFDRILSARPDWWIAYYCRGINHLHWPRALLHSDAAIADFQQCLKLQKRDRQTHDYYLRTYVALGDAFVKTGKPSEARKAWNEGLGIFPNSTELKQRLAIPERAALLKYVESVRTLEQAIDTDLSFLDGQSLVRH